MFRCVILPQQITSDRMETCTDLSAEQLANMFQDPAFWKTLPVIASTKEWLCNVHEIGWDIILMTDRFWYPQIQEDTRTWLTENGIPCQRLEFSRRAEKPERARELGIRVFIEDQLSNANTLGSVCEKVFLIDRTYNQGALSPNVTRIATCSECSVHLL